MQICALLLIMFSAIVGLPSLKEGGQPGIRDKQTLAVNPDQVAEQQRTQDNVQWAYMAVSALAGLTILMGAHKGTPGLIVGMVTIAAGTCLVIFGMSIHSKVHHPGPPQGTGKVSIPVATQRQAVKARATAQIKDQQQP